jgi:hypothetical protein
VQEVEEEVEVEVQEVEEVRGESGCAAHLVHQRTKGVRLHHPIHRRLAAGVGTVLGLKTAAGGS